MTKWASTHRLTFIESDLSIGNRNPLVLAIPKRFFFHINF